MEAKTVQKIGVLALALLLLMGSTLVVGAVSPQERNREAVERYSKAKDSYRDAVEVYKNAREDYMGALERFRKFRHANDSAAALEKGKTFLLRATDGMMRYLEMLEKRVEVSKLGEEEKAEIKAEIEKDAAWLEGKQNAIKSATTREELAAIAKEVKEYWGNIRGNTKSIAGKLLSLHTDGIISKLENASARIENTIQKLKEEGKDASKLEAKLTEFKEKIALAKDANAKAKAKFSEIKDIKDADKLFREGHAFVKEANKYLRETYGVLKEIFKELREMRREGREELGRENETAAANATVV